MSSAAADSTGFGESTGGTSCGETSHTGMAGTSFDGHSDCIFSRTRSDGSAEGRCMCQGIKGGISGEADSGAMGTGSGSSSQSGSGVGGNGDNRSGTCISLILATSSSRVNSCDRLAQVSRNASN